MNAKEHVTLRVPKDLHEEIMNTNEHSTKNAKYLARLRGAKSSGLDQVLEQLEEIKNNQDTIINEITRS